MAQSGGRAATNWTSLPGMMLDMARRQPRAPMLRYWRGRGWQRMAWAEFAHQVASVAAFLRGRGIEPGDRVLLVSENRPEFLIADTAIMAIGAVSVPTYTTNTERDHTHILENSGARAAIVSTARLAQVLLPAIVRSSTCEFLIAMESLPPSSTRTLSFAAMAGDPQADVGAAAELGAEEDVDGI